MAAPQKENGFTALANEIWEAMECRPFTGSQWSILARLWRETYGWHRTQAPFSLGLIERTTGILEKKASELLAELVALGVIERVRPAAGSVAAVYRFEKDHERWHVRPRRDGGPPTGESPHRGSGGSPTGGGEDSPTGGPFKERVKEKQQQGVPPQGEETIPDLIGRVVRQLTQLQPSGLSQEDRKTVGELLRNTDKTQRRVLEAVTDAVRQTQEERRGKQITAPIRYALRIAGRMLSEPEPMPAATPEFVKAPEGWTAPYETKGAKP